MPDSFFVFSILVLLLTPGPTNTLLTLGGAAKGLPRAFPLLAGELAGYLCVVIPLATLAADFIAEHPVVGTTIRLTAAAWVLFLAVRLWIARPRQEDANGNAVTIGQVFVTTILNPKAVIIGLLLMPRGSLMDIAPALAAFSSLVLVAGSGFIVLGGLLRRGGSLAHPRLVYRLAATFLLVFSLGLVGNASGLL